MDAYSRRNVFFEKDFDRLALYVGILDEKLLQLVKDSKPKTQDKIRTKQNPAMGGKRG